MRKKVKGFTLIELMTVIFIITLLIAIMIPNLMRARQRAQLTSCESNLKSQATANTIYANDNNGHYAKYPGLLMPNYLKAKPTCASAGTYTYFYLVSQKPGQLHILLSRRLSHLNSRQQQLPSVRLNKWIDGKIGAHFFPSCDSSACEMKKLTISLSIFTAQSHLGDILPEYCIFQSKQYWIHPGGLSCFPANF